MKKLSAILLGLCLCYILNANTALFVHTNREAKLEGGSKAIEKGELAPAKGVVIDSQDGGRVSLVLTNKVVIDVVGKAKLIIEEASQDVPVAFDKTKAYEEKKSNTKVRVEYGKVYFKLPELRPTSSFEVSTAMGVYNLNCKYFRLNSSKECDDVLLYDGVAILNRDESKTRLNDAYLSNLSINRGKAKLSASRAGLVAQEAKDLQFKDVENIYEGTLFEFGDEAKAIRVLPEKFIFEELQNNHFRN